MDHPVLSSPRMLYKTEREIARTRFELEVEYEAWSPATKARTALAILIFHGLFSKTIEMGSFNDFKGVAEELLASASQRMKVVEAFSEFSMMEVSSKRG